MNILFVCTGNTCRSCMAEAIFNSICDVENIKALSAGVSVITSSITSESSALLVKNFLNMDIASRAAKQITTELLDEVDLVLTMTNSHKRLLAYDSPQLLHNCKLYTLNEYIGEKGDISDPFGGNLNLYKQTYTELESKIKALLQKLKEGI